MILSGWRVKVSICTPTIHSLNHNSGARLLHQWSPNGGWQNRRQGVRITVRLPHIIVRIIIRVPGCSISVPRMSARLIVITAQIITRVPVCSISVPLRAPRVLLTPWTQSFLVVVMLASVPLNLLQLVVSPGKNIEHLQHQITDSGCACAGLGLAPAITASIVDLEKYSQRCGFMRRTSARSMGGPMM